MSRRTEQAPIKLTRKIISDPLLINKTQNIFEVDDSPEPRQMPRTPYHIVGDREFKTKFRLNNTVDTDLNNMTIDSGTNPEKTTTSYFVRTRRSLLSELKKPTNLFQVQQQNFMTRDHKTLTNFNKIDSYWKKYSGKTQAPVRLFIDNNIDKQEMVKQQGNQYWKMSLRNNDKRLLRHIRGVPFDKQQYLRNLQTKKGLQLMEESVHPVPVGSYGFQLHGKKRSQSIDQSTVERAQHYSEEVMLSTWRNRNISRLHQF